MSTQRKSSWQVKRDKAIERFVSALENSGETSDDAEEENMALDAVTVAHLGAAFEIEGRPNIRWEEFKANAIVLAIAAWRKYETEHDPVALHELNAALDMLAVAHMAATFEFASGPLKW